ncbi:MAG: NAD-binding protein, partial [Puniceicoccales bacterium]|nr:NAD-binding protein [Puniceicoccales bacterium]
HTLAQDRNCFNYQAHFDIDYFIMPHVLCALEIAKRIRTPHRVQTEHFSRGQVEMRTLVLGPGSKWVGRPLNELDLGANVRIGYLQRNTQFILPTRDTVLEANDLVTLAADTEAIPEIIAQTQRSSGDHKRIVVFSGGDVALALVQRLNHPRFRIKIIEPDRSLCEDIAEDFGQLSVVQGNAACLPLLSEEGIETCDHFVACGSNDEQNIMACLQAKRVGVKTIHLVLNNPDYEPVAESVKSALGVDHLILPKPCVYDDTVRFLSPKPVSVLGQLTQGDRAEILEINLAPGSRCEGKTIREIGWPAGTVLLVLNHRFRSKVPSASDALIGGDSLIVVVKEENKNRLLNLFAAS